MENTTIMNLATNLIDTLLVFYFIKTALNKDIKDKRYATFLIIGLITINTYINSNLGIASIIGFLAIFIISIIIYSSILDSKFLQTLYSGIIATIFMFVIEIIVIYLIIMIFRIKPSMIYEINIYRIMAIAISKSIMLLVIKVGIKSIRNVKNFKLEQQKSIIVVSLFNLIIIYMTFILYRNLDMKNKFSNLFLIGMSLGAIIFSWLIYLITKKLVFQAQQEVIWKLKEEEIRKNDFYVSNMKEMLWTIKGQRHDMNNHLNTIYGLLENDRFNEAKVYIGELNKNISVMNEIVDINHPTISTLLNIKKNIADGKMIKFNIDISLTKDVTINDVDLSIILNNLLDNSIEACEKINGSKKYLDIHISIKEDYLIIKVANCKDESIKLDPQKLLNGYTTKQNSEIHGIGLRNVKLIVDKYNGIMTLKDEGNIFLVDIALLMDKTTI